MNQIVNEIFTSIHLITDKKLSQARLDKTVQAVVVAHPTVTTNQYRITYQGVEYDAFGSTTDVYEPNQSVLVLIPENNFANKKIILGLSDRTAQSLNDFVLTTGSVTSVTFGSTGLTPSTPTGGAISVDGILNVSNGGTGTSNGSINGTGDLTFTAGGANGNVILAPQGSGAVDVSSKRIANVTNPTLAQDAATKAYVDSMAGGNNFLSASYITASTITATNISVNTLTASSINITSLSATNISSNTLTASVANISSLSASQITASSINLTGNLSASSISASTITASNISSNVLTSSVAMLASISASRMTVSSVNVTGNISVSSITASVITSSLISTDILTASVANISSLSASRITASSINLTGNLSASSITASYITSSNISANSLTSSLINVTNLNNTTLTASLANITNLNNTTLTSSLGSFTTLTSSNISSNILTSSVANLTSINASRISASSLSIAGNISVGSITVSTISASSVIQGNSFISTVTTGTPPLTVSSTTLVTNLNADLLDGQHGSYYQNAGNLNAGTLLGARLSTSSPYSILLTTPKNGVLRANLGNQTLNELTLEPSEATNKTWFFNISKTTFEYTSDGVSWVTWTVTDTEKQNLFSGRYTGTRPVITNGWVAARIQLEATSYVYLDYLYHYISSNGHDLKMKIERSYDGSTWSDVVSDSGNANSWPGHFFLPHTTIPWHPSPTLGTHYKFVRVTYTPTWNGTYPSNNIDIHLLNWFGGYPIANREIYSWDSFRNVNFPAALRGAAGSVTTPSISFSSDINTGLFNPTADTIAFVEGGVEVMRIDSNSNVGIGTTGATAKLEVVGTISSSNFTTNRITASSINATGNISASSVSASFMTSSNISANSLTASLANITNLNNTTLTSSLGNFTTLTSSNISTNILTASTANLTSVNATNLTVSSVNITANLSVTNISINSLTSSIINSTNINSTNLTATNINAITFTTSNVSTNILTASVSNIINLNNTTLTSSLGNFTTLTSSNISTGILTASNMNVTNFTATNISSNILTASTGSFDSIIIKTVNRDAVITKNTRISGLSNSGLSLNVTSQDTNPTGVFLSPDGAYAYIIGQGNDVVRQYSLSTPWNISTGALYTSSVYVGDSTPTDLFFKPDGTRLYVLCDTVDSVREFILSTPWNVSPGSMTFSTSFAITQETSPRGIWFKPDGTVMYMIGNTNDKVHQFTLGTAWSSSTAVASSISASFTNPPVVTPTAVNFNEDGTSMYILDGYYDAIHQFSLSPAWTLTSSTLISSFPMVLENAGEGMFINFQPTASYAYVVGTTNDRIYQYSLSDRSIISEANLAIAGDLNVQNTFYVGGASQLQSSLKVYGSSEFNNSALFNSTLTAVSTLSLNGTGVGNANFATAVNSGLVIIGTNLTTGQLAIGGTTQSSQMFFGRSTNSYTVSIAMGTVSSGLRQTIELGTGGASGSITNIDLGSRTAGALGTVTIRSNTVIPEGYRLGIGTRTPSTVLEVAGTSSISMIYLGTGSVSAPSLVAVNDTNTGIYFPAADSIGFVEGGVDVLRINSSGNVGIGTNTPSYKLQVLGDFAATTKSFVIPHPIDPKKLLRYGSLEGPENGIYIRGRATSSIIMLPDYFEYLVHEDSITVHLNPIGSSRVPIIKSVSSNNIILKPRIFGKIDCYYIVFAERKDVPRLEVEV